MKKKLFIILSFIILILVSIYYFIKAKPTKVQLNAPLDMQAKTENGELLYTPIPPRDIPVPSNEPMVLNDADPETTKIRDEFYKLEPTPIDLKTLNKQNCSREIFKAALWSYRVKRFSFFTSTAHCLNNIYKLSEAEQLEYRKMFGAAGKHEKFFVLNGKKIDLSEENLIKLSK